MLYCMLYCSVPPCGILLSLLPAVKGGYCTSGSHTAWPLPLAPLPWTWGRYAIACSNS
jgi:hypothetical protein